MGTKKTTVEAVKLAGTAWDVRTTLWWTGRGRQDAQDGKAPLFRLTVSGVRTEQELPDDWSDAYAEAAARTYLDAYNAAGDEKWNQETAQTERGGARDCQADEYARHAAESKVESWDGLNGAMVIANSTDGDANYIRLPSQLQRPIDGGCSCPYCKANPKLIPTWDTLVVPKKGTAWTVHMPDPKNKTVL